MGKYEISEIIRYTILILLLAPFCISMLRKHGKNAFLMLFVWILIFVAVSLIYVYRSAISDILEDMKLHLFPGYIVEKEKVIQVARNKDNHFYLPIKVNGVTLNFLVDSGATNVSLNKESAIKVGIDISKLDFIHDSYTANGISKHAVTTVNELSLGGHKLRNFQVSVTSGDLDTPLLGMSFLTTMSSIQVREDIMFLVYKK